MSAVVFLADTSPFVQDITHDREVLLRSLTCFTSYTSPFVQDIAHYREVL